jgi:hypothetical protein
MKPSHVSRELRRIASKIDGSTNPSSKLVANDLKRVLAAMGGSDSRVRVQFTDDSEMGSTPPSYTSSSMQEIVRYLNSSPRNAVIVQSNTGFDIAVFRGASDSLDNFYVQPLPLDEPDADGGSWSAQEAMQVAMNY